MITNFPAIFLGCSCFPFFLLQGQTFNFEGLPPFFRYHIIAHCRRLPRGISKLPGDCWFRISYDIRKYQIYQKPKEHCILSQNTKIPIIAPSLQGSCFHLWICPHTHLMVSNLCWAPNWSRNLCFMLWLWFEQWKKYIWEYLRNTMCKIWEIPFDFPDSHTHTSHVFLPLLGAQFERHPLFTVSHPATESAFYPHSPNLTHTKTTKTSRAGSAESPTYILCFSQFAFDLVLVPNRILYITDPTITFLRTIWPSILRPHMPRLISSSFFKRNLSSKPTVHVSTNQTLRLPPMIIKKDPFNQWLSAVMMRVHAPVCKGDDREGGTIHMRHFCDDIHNMSRAWQILIYPLQSFVHIMALPE